MILCDSDVLIEHFRGSSDTRVLLTKLSANGLAVSAISVMELYFGARDKRELAQLRKVLAPLTHLSVSEEISTTATDLVFRFAKSHALSVPDALIAATAICHNLDLLSYNRKHFSQIPGLKLLRS